jgi:hypothetical protein
LSLVASPLVTAFVTNDECLLTDSAQVTALAFLLYRAIAITL